jgi:NAD(P)-dependent dehydrogenase (short-subunit alcohol dehydrogenase family)
MTQLRVLVTGGGRGIGRDVAIRFAREGAKVVVAARSSDQLDAVVAEIDAAGGEGLAAQMNVGDYGSVEAAVYRALQFTGGALDVLVNCAGVREDVPFGKLDLATWSRHVDVNLTGAFLVALEALEGLEEGSTPHVFHVCAPATDAPRASSAAFLATKQGLRGLSDAMRVDLADADIRVSAVFPAADGAAAVGPAVAEAVVAAYRSGERGDVNVSG